MKPSISKYAMSHTDFKIMSWTCIHARYIIFEYNGIKYIKKFATKILKEDFKSRPMMNIDLIGKVTSDGFNNKGVIEIIDLEFK